jgi:hypothetical protein
MRLLEFDQDDSSADIQQTAHITSQVKDLPGTPAVRVPPVKKPVSAAKSTPRVFPIKSETLRKPAQRGPIDLEALQQRVVALEKRVKERAENKRSAIASQELEELKQRLLKLERNISGELWLAKQREYTMLEILARPPLAKRINHGVTRILTHNLPAIGRWFKEAAIERFDDNKPDWWPTLAAAWKESLDKARGVSQH